MIRLLSWLYERFSGARSPQWPEVRAQHLRQHPRCECCGSRNNLEVHHQKPVNAYPELELEPSNLRTVCHDCHLLVGHCRDYHSWNPRFDDDARYISKMVLRKQYGRQPGV